MGHTYQANCLKCGTDFQASEGGGFYVHLLHFDKCGREKFTRFKDLGEIQIAYMKGADFEFSSGSDEFDKKACEYQGEPIFWPEYEKRVEEFAGKCRCRGQYRMDGKVRCPKCRSDEIEAGGYSGFIRLRKNIRITLR